MRGALAIFALFTWSAVFASESFVLPQETVLDVGRVEPAALVFQFPVRNIEDARLALNLAQEKNLKVSIRGTNHSQGGHNFLAHKDHQPTSIQLLTSGWNKIVHIDRDNKMVVVEPGITWRELQIELNRLRLALITQQSSNIFSVGGSVATNIHGRDNSGPLRNSIESLRLLTADGSEHVLSRQQNPELFLAVIGGYGGFGVVSEVTLKITDNFAYMAQSSNNLTVQQYLERYIEPLRKSSNEQRLHWGRISIHGAERQIVLGPIAAVTWSIADKQPSIGWEGWQLLGQDVIDNKLSSALMAVNRVSPIGKTLKSSVDQVLGLPRNGVLQSRNNIMNPPVDFLIDYSGSALGTNDILQEYFVPPEALPNFIEKLQLTVRKYQLNLLNVTLRYIPPSSEKSLISYESASAAVAVVVYFNVRDEEEKKEKQIHYSGEKWTQDLVDKSIQLGGSFYLPYQRWWTSEQLDSAYGKDNILKFKVMKAKVDPNYLFDSNFIRTVMND